MNKRFVKAISIIVLSVFVINTATVDFAYSRQNDPVVTYQSAPVAINVANVVIPKRLGYVDARFSGKGGKVVFHIKDAHCNYAAQKAVYDLVDWIVEKYGVGLLNLEGATGDYDMSLLEDIKDPFVKQEIIDK